MHLMIRSPYHRCDDGLLDNPEVVAAMRTLTDAGVDGAMYDKLIRLQS